LAESSLTSETESEQAGETSQVARGPRAALLQEVLLRTDGTVTDLLELFTGEPIRIAKVSSGFHNAECDWPNKDGEPQLIVRDVILCGKTTESRYIFGHTHVYPEALAPAVHLQLQETNEPIGKVLRDQRVEDFRQIEGRGCRPMPLVAEILGVAATDQLQWRRYSVTSGASTIMEITEVFSERLFASPALPM
jgi:chorismate-pyruvate lyase